MILRIWRDLSSSPSPRSSIPALLEITVSCFTPSSDSAAIRCSAMPHSPKPPDRIDMPSCAMSARAAFAFGNTLPPPAADVAMVTPASDCAIRKTEMILEPGWSLHRQSAAAAGHRARLHASGRQARNRQSRKQRSHRHQLVALPVPALYQPPQYRQQLHAFQLGMQREYMIGAPGAGAFQQRLVHGVHRHAIHADQFIERGQRGRQLRAGAATLRLWRRRRQQRHERRLAARVRGVDETHLFFQFERGLVHLPAGGPMHLRLDAEYLAKPVHRTQHLVARPGLAAPAYEVLPGGVIEGMYTDLVAVVTNAAHDVSGA